VQELRETHPDLDVHSFDESRFGTHSKIGHGWFDRGDRPRVKIKMGFENFYVYSSVNADTGEMFSLLMPNVNTDCMNIFLAEFAIQLGKRHTFLIMDRAAWHKAKALVVPRNIHIVLLPPYSPELNPVEQLWRYMKSKIIKNRIYESLEELYSEVAALLNNLHPTLVSTVCAAKYLQN